MSSEAIDSTAILIPFRSWEKNLSPVIETIVETMLHDIYDNGSVKLGSDMKFNIHRCDDATLPGASDARPDAKPPLKMYLPAMLQSFDELTKFGIRILLSNFTITLVKAGRPFHKSSDNEAAKHFREFLTGLKQRGFFAGTDENKIRDPKQFVKAIADQAGFDQVFIREFPNVVHVTMTIDAEMMFYRPGSGGGGDSDPNRDWVDELPSVEDLVEKLGLEVLLQKDKLRTLWICIPVLCGGHRTEYLVADEFVAMYEPIKKLADWLTEEFSKRRGGRSVPQIQFFGCHYPCRVVWKRLHWVEEKAGFAIGDPFEPICAWPDIPSTNWTGPPHVSKFRADPGCQCEKFKRRIIDPFCVCDVCGSDRKSLGS